MFRPTAGHWIAEDRGLHEWPTDGGGTEREVNTALPDQQDSPPPSGPLWMRAKFDDSATLAVLANICGCSVEEFEKRYRG